MNVEKLKAQDTISREDINNLLKSIGKPGQKREEKIAAVKQLEKQNFQGIALHESLADYEAF